MIQLVNGGTHALMANRKNNKIYSLLVNTTLTYIYRKNNNNNTNNKHKKGIKPEGRKKLQINSPKTQGLPVEYIFFPFCCCCIYEEKKWYVVPWCFGLLLLSLVILGAIKSRSCCFAFRFLFTCLHSLWTRADNSYFKRWAYRQFKCFDLIIIISDGRMRDQAQFALTIQPETEGSTL